MIDYARISHMLAYEQSMATECNAARSDDEERRSESTRGWEYPLRCYSADEKHRGLRGTGRAL